MNYNLTIISGVFWGGYYNATIIEVRLRYNSLVALCFKSACDAVFRGVAGVVSAVCQRSLFWRFLGLLGRVRGWLCGRFNDRYDVTIQREGGQIHVERGGHFAKNTPDRHRETTLFWGDRC